MKYKLLFTSLSLLFCHSFHGVLPLCTGFTYMYMQKLFICSIFKQLGYTYRWTRIVDEINSYFNSFKEILNNTFVWHFIFFYVLFSVLVFFENLLKRKLRLIFGKMFGGKILMQVINLGLNYTRKHNEDTIGHSWNVW